jgi:hypothetical protein
MYDLKVRSSASHRYGMVVAAMRGSEWPGSSDWTVPRDHRGVDRPTYSLLR